METKETPIIFIPHKGIAQGYQIRGLFQYVILNYVCASNKLGMQHARVGLVG